MAYVTLPDFPEVIAYNPTTEDADFSRLLSKRGIAIAQEREVAVGTFMGGFATEYAYQHEGKHRWAYVVPHRLEIDAFGEESLICQAPIEDINRLADAFLLARKT